MANKEQLAILKQGVQTWNQWRKEHRDILPDLSEADLSKANLSRAFLWEADLSKATLKGAKLKEAELGMADLRGADLSEADLGEARLRGAGLSKATLKGADLGSRFDRSFLDDFDLFQAYRYHRGQLPRRANLTGANLSGATLSGANLTGAVVIGTNFTEATITDSRIYGVAAWDVQLKGAKQNNLVITDIGQPTITVDNLEVAQFIYLLLNNAKVRDAIDTLTTKAVLILGRFTPERKAILETIRKLLRQRDYLPILFDFDKPASRDITETVSTLAHLSRFIIADITDAKSVPQELMIIVPHLPSVPVQPLILESQREYGMFEHFKKFPWVLQTHYYQDLEDLMASLQTKVIEPAVQKAQELEKR